jgi:hypothetical protein
MNQMRRRATHIDVYRCVIENEKLTDDQLVEKLRMEFVFDSRITNCCLYDVIQCTRSTRPPVIRMGPVPVTNWCMKG